MATIRKRGSLWEARVRRKGWPIQNQSFPKKSAAIQWASVIESEMTRRAFVDPALLKSLTLGDLFRRYANEISPTKKSQQSEQCRIGAFLRDPLSETRLTDLTGRRLAIWRDQRMTKVTGSTVNRDLNLISHVCNIARKEWDIPVENPIGDIRRPKHNRARTRRLSLAEQERLISALTPAERASTGLFTGPQNPWMVPLVLLALETAMRRSELLALRWDHVHLDECYAQLLETKNGTSRDVPLSSTARRILESLPRHPSGSVFPVSGNAVKLAFTRATQRAGIPDLHFHDLRHEATTRLSDKLENILELSAVTGHKTLSGHHRHGVLLCYCSGRASGGPNHSQRHHQPGWPQG